MTPPLRHSWIPDGAMGWLAAAAPVAPRTLIISAPIDPPLDESESDEEQQIESLTIERDRLKRELEQTRMELAPLEENIVEGARSPVAVRLGPWSATFAGVPLIGIVLADELERLRAELAEYPHALGGST